MAEDTGLLQQEIQQTRPFASVAEEAVLAVVRTADHLKHQMSALLDPHGISLQQYNVLRILRGAGPAGIPTLEIIDRMIERSPGITRMIDRLVQRGWADRARCANDRRVVYCQITPAGTALLEALDGPLGEAPDQMMTRLTEAQRTQLVELLELVRGGADVPSCGDIGQA